MMEELVDSNNQENIECALKNVVVAGAGGDEDGFKECLQEKLRLADIGVLILQVLPLVWSWLSWK
jgi:hypothetical protein